MTYVLGLTGSIATGKSTVAEVFKAHHIPLIDSDLGAREIVEKGQPLLADLEEYFGPEIIQEDGTLNRQVLGNIVFNDDQAMYMLNKLNKPYIRRWILDKRQEMVEQGHPLIILDIPLLYEANYQANVDGVMVVYSHPDQQKVRLMKRNQYSEAEAQARINNQMSIEDKKNKADFIIDNTGSIESTRQQVEDWLKKNFPSLADEG